MTRMTVTQFTAQENRDVTVVAVSAFIPFDASGEAAHPCSHMKPGDHPEFFRVAAPPGASRESTIRLDADGHFWHDGEKVEHAALEAALHGWIARHPDDARFILTNGYDWTYFQVDDAPYAVRAVRLRDGVLTIELSDGSEEPLDLGSLGVGANDALYASVKGGTCEARFSRHAQLALAPWLEEAGEEGARLRVEGRLYAIEQRKPAVEPARVVGAANPVR